MAEVGAVGGKGEVVVVAQEGKKLKAEEEEEEEAGWQVAMGGVSGLSEWDVVSEKAAGEQFSTGSLTSEESDAVVIFGGRKRKGGSSACLERAGSFSSDTCRHSAVLQQHICESDDDEEASMVTRQSGWQHRHQRLVSAVSDLASDPGLNRVNADIYGGLEQSMPIEQRLLDQIARLAEELDDSQEQSKLLLLQNDRLMTDNETLKRRVDDLLRGDNGKNDNGDEEQPDIMRVTFAVAAGIVIIGLAKKKLLLNGMGLLSAAVVGGCVGLFQHLNNTERKRRAE